MLRGFVFWGICSCDTVQSVFFSFSCTGQQRVDQRGITTKILILVVYKHFYVFLSGSRLICF